jgi:predicted alpha/beta-hydrolase family hydrolase
MDEIPGSQEGHGSPLDQLHVLALQSVAIDDDLNHLEIYTTEGLLTVLWHGADDLENVVVCVGGAMGGLLGPDGGLFHLLGRHLPAEGIGVVRVSYRQPNALPMCVHDTLAVMELAARHGARRFIPLGHSFGGAIAVQAAAHLEAWSVPGLVTFATQSAGCEPIELLADRDLLFFHGTADQILPPQASELVRMLAGAGELVLLDGADHGLRPAGGLIFDRLAEHLPAVFASAPDQPGSS